MEIKKRVAGNQAGTLDTYYHSPTGKRCVRACVRLCVCVCVCVRVHERECVRASLSSSIIRKLKHAAPQHAHTHVL